MKRDDFERAVDEELRFHVQSRADRLTRAGMPPHEARREAARRFGDFDRVRNECLAEDLNREREMRRGELLSELAYDLRHGLRLIRRKPGASLVSIGILALGLAAAAVMLGIVDRLLLSPPPGVHNAKGTLRMYTRFRAADGTEVLGSFRSSGFETLRAQVTGFDAVAGYGTMRRELGRAAQAAQVVVAGATANFFPVLGVRPALGRFFAADEDTGARGAPVAVLSHAVWQSRFGSDSSIVGRTIEIDRQAFTVIGITEHRFAGLDLTPVEIWIPYSSLGAHLGSANWRTARMGANWLTPVVRLRDGRAREEVQREASIAHLRGTGLEPTREALASGGVLLAPLNVARGPGHTTERTVALLLAAIAAVVLLIACANSLGLTLLRAMGRRREVEIRAALGVSRGRLLRQFMSEAALTAFTASAAATTFAFWGGVLAQRLIIPDIASSESLVSGTVIAFVAATLAVLTFLGGALPLRHLRRHPMTTYLRTGNLADRSGGQTALLVVQTAFSMMLVVGAGLFARSLAHASSVDVGFDVERVHVAQVSLGTMGWELGRRDAFYAAALDRLRADSRIDRASLTSSVPFRMAMGGEIRVDRGDTAGVPAVFYAVDRDYFATLGVRLIRGRVFELGDGPTAPEVVVVNETLARRHWSGLDPLSQCIQLRGGDAPCARVIGVVGDVHRIGLREDVVSLSATGRPLDAQVYTSLAQRPADWRSRYLVIRPAPGVDRAEVGTLVRGALQGLAAELPYISVAPLAVELEPELRPWRLGAAVLVTFGTLALALCAAGLYAVISYGASLRQREIGIRIALGAPNAGIVSLLARRGAMIGLGGLLLGGLASLVAGPFLKDVLFGVTPRDPVVLGGAVALVMLTATVASLIPAIRAGRVDPVAALRDE